MVWQLSIGAVLIAATVALQALIFGVATHTLTKAGTWLIAPPQSRKTIISLIGVTLWLMVGHSIGAWLWAFTFMLLGAFDALEPALYFSLVTFTTLGYGDVTLSSDWRILSALTAANGLLIFGLSTAFLVEFMSQLDKAQGRAKASSVDK